MMLVLWFHKNTIEIEISKIQIRNLYPNIIKHKSVFYYLDVKDYIMVTL